MGTGFAKKKKEAKLFQQQFQKLQTELKEKEFSGTAGYGLVIVTLNGEGILKQIKIKPECVDPEDVDGLEMLIKAAFEDAHRKIESQTSAIPGLPPGILPGL